MDNIYNRVHRFDWYTGSSRFAFIFLLLQLLAGAAKAQTKTDPLPSGTPLPGNTVRKVVRLDTLPPEERKLFEARGYLYGNGLKPYYPEKAFEIYSQLARQGNVKAMNALGILYSQGVAVEANPAESLKWFQLAAGKGYTKALFNLGEMYRKGHGVPQDFTKAYAYYSQASLVDDTATWGMLAYLHYKGFGCRQDYKKAFDLYNKSAWKGSPNSMYFLGLFYRNGYGTAANTDSARYWLTLALSKGERQAKEELASPEPENMDAGVPAADVKKRSRKKPAAAPARYRKVIHNLNENDITGYYTGYAIRYDWSGQHVISRSTLRLHLTQKDHIISGEWIEDDSLNAPLQATLTDSGLVFNNTQYSRIHHYSPNKPELFEFRNTRLELVKNKNRVHLAGNIQLYSPKRKEPAKPLYITLSQVQEKDNLSFAPEAAVVTADKRPAATEIKRINPDGLLVYPNPFNNCLNVEFSLPAVADVKISLLSLEGKVILTKDLRQSASGKHKESIPVNISPGAYLLTVTYGGDMKTAVIVKQ